MQTSSSNRAGPSSQALRRLLLSFPDVEVERDGSAVLDALVLGASVYFASQEGAPHIIFRAEVISTLRAQIGLSFETAEVAAALDRLAETGRLSFANTERKAFVLAPAVQGEVSAGAKERSERADRVRQEWLAELSSRHADLPEERKQLLADGLEAYLASVVNHQAAEAASFLYYSRSDEDRARFVEALDAVTADVEEFVIPEVVAIAREEFPRFVLEVEGERRTYLADLLHASFYFHLLNLDPVASELVRSAFEGKVLYIDTNFIYRLLGLQGPMLAFEPATVVEMSQKLNCEIRVAAVTVDEFLMSLRSVVGRLNQTPLTREDYQQVAATFPVHESEFMQTYYRQLVSGQIRSVAEFERKYSNVVTILEGWGIAADEEAGPTEDLLKSEAFCNRLSQLAQWHRQEKRVELEEHDVYLEHRTRQLRGDRDRTPSSVRCWTLTYDRSLTRFAARRTGKGQLPFCLLASDWLQIVRPFMPRTADFDAAFVSILRQPLMLAEKTVPFEHIVEALSRLEKYEQLPAKLAARMVTDQEFLRRLQVTERPEAERELVQLAVAEQAEELQRELDSVKAVREIDRERVRELEQRLHELERSMAASESSGEEKVARAKDEVAGLAGELALERLKRRRWLQFAGAGASVLVVGSVFLSHFWGELSWPRRGVLTGLTIGVLMLLLLIPLRSRARVWVIGSWTVLGAFAAAAECWTP